MSKGIGLEDIPGYKEAQETPTQEDCPKPGFINSSQPFGMPEGTIRALITLVIVVAGCAATYAWKDIPGALGVAFGTVITSYFQTRSTKGA
jgi:hypothetical protein